MSTPFDDRSRNAFYSTAPLTVHARELVVRDPTLFGLGLLVGLLPAAVFGVIAVPAVVVAGVPATIATTEITPVVAVVGVAGWLSAVTTIMLSAAIVAAVSAEADGRHLTVAESLQQLRGRWRELVAWAMLRTVLSVVGMLVERLGPVGHWLRFLGSLGFALATIFVMPAIVISGAMPGEAVLSSSRMVKDTFGFTLKTNFRALTPWMLLALVAALVALAGLLVRSVYATEVPSWAAAGSIIAALGVVGFFLACGMQTAVSACVNTLIYRHGIGLPVPGVDPWSLPGRERR